MRKPLLTFAPMRGLTYRWARFLTLACFCAPLRLLLRVMVFKVASHELAQHRRRALQHLAECAHRLALGQKPKPPFGLIAAQEGG
jgi:hypothetical protein